MKHIILSLLILGCCLAGCSKKNDPTPPFNPEGTTWSGSFAAGAAVGLYSFKLQAGGVVAWHEMAGDKAGKWSREGNKLVLEIGTMRVKADISDSRELTAIENLAGPTLIAGALVPEALAVAPEKGSKWLNTKGGGPLGGVYVWRFDNPFLDFIDTNGFIKTSADFFTWKDGGLYFTYKLANVPKSDFAVMDKRGRYLWGVGTGQVEFTRVPQ